MPRKSTRAKKQPASPARSRRAKPSRARDTVDLEGPPPREALFEVSDLERERIEPPDRASTPELTGGDIDADWLRAASSGEEAVGGSVLTPDKDVVDDLGDALGVPRGPDEEFRSSAEILEQRDARRGHLEG
jgi:hypothetical protein